MGAAEVNLQSGMLVRQMTICTDPMGLNTGVACVSFATSQSYALNVSAKLNMFLKMIMQVKPSMAKSPASHWSAKGVTTGERAGLR